MIRGAMRLAAVTALIAEVAVGTTPTDIVNGGFSLKESCWAIVDKGPGVWLEKQRVGLETDKLTAEQRQHAEEEFETRAEVCVRQEFRLRSAWELSECHRPRAFGFLNGAAWASDTQVSDRVIQSVDEAEMSVAQIYLNFIVDPQPAVITGGESLDAPDVAVGSLSPVEVRACLRGLFKGVKRGESLSSSVLSQRCNSDITTLIATPIFLKTSTVRAPVAVIIHSKGTVVGANVWTADLHEVLHVLQGSAQATVCTTSVAATVFHLWATGIDPVETVNYQVSSFRPNHARFPRVKDAAVLCEHTDLGAGDRLLVPRGHVFTYKAGKRGVIVALHAAVDELNWNVIREQVAIREILGRTSGAVHRKDDVWLKTFSAFTRNKNQIGGDDLMGPGDPRYSSVAALIDVSPRSTFMDWQQIIRLKVVRQEASMIVPKITLDKASRSTLELALEFKGIPGSVAMLEVVWRTKGVSEDVFSTFTRSRDCRRNSVGQQTQDNENIDLLNKVCDVPGMLGFTTTDVTLPSNEDKGTNRSVVARSFLKLSRLFAGVEYLIRARSRSVHYSIAGPWSEWMMVSTHEEVAPDAPKQLTVKPCVDDENSSGSLVLATCALVTWREPKETGGYPVESYIIEYWEDGEWRDIARRRQEIDADLVVDTTDAQSLRIEALRPGRTHRFRVAARSRAGTSPFTEPSPALMLWSLMRGAAALKSVFALFESKDPIPIEQLQQTFLERYAQDPARVVLDLVKYGKTGSSDSAAATVTGISHRQGPVVTLSDVLQHVFLHREEEAREQQQLDKLASSLPAWAAQHSPRMYDVHANVVWAEPLDACSALSKITVNDERNLLYKDKIVVVKRGKCPLLEKVQNAHAEMAAGIIILDNGTKCDVGFDHRCSPGSAKHNGEGFAKHDKLDLWTKLHLPTVIVGRSAFKQAFPSFAANVL